MSYVIPIYNRFPMSAVRGEGIFLYDDKGTPYIDGCAGYAVTNLGHSHPDLRAALHEQVDTLWHSSNAVHVPQQEVLAERLCKLSFGKKAFFCNSGAEAWEATIKIARKYHKDKGHPEKWRGIVMRGCFHGRSFAGISAAMRPYMVDGFQPLVEGFDIVEPHDLEALEAAITDNTAYINVEPVLGEGGLLALDDDYMRGIRNLCNKYDILMVVDEVQCGMGRTGKMFAYQWSGAEPDIMALAKGLGNGFPIGAYVVGEKCANVLTPTTHGSTFGGNPLACAVGNAVIDLMTDPDFLPHVLSVGEHLKKGLQILAADYPKLLEPVIRGRGLMLAVQCKDEGGNDKLSQAAFAEKLLTIPAMQNVLRVMPPLIITEEQADELLLRLRRACAALNG